MAKIVYKPHCSECGAVINEKIQYRNIIEELNLYPNSLGHEFAEIFPGRCEHCGQLFTQIEIPMPEQLPTERIK